MTTNIKLIYDNSKRQNKRENRYFYFKINIICFKIYKIK